MSMSKKDFVALADALQPVMSSFDVNAKAWGVFVNAITNFCESQNPRFDRDRWLAYLRGECGPNGGKL